MIVGLTLVFKEWLIKGDDVAEMSMALVQREKKTKSKKSQVRAPAWTIFEIWGSFCIDRINVTRDKTIQM